MLIKYVGAAYASKTLRCICPREYGAFDFHVKKALADFLPKKDDKEADIVGYLGFLHICNSLQDQEIGRAHV
jgi:hypothetical protein